jgi:hypothetical protein
MPKRPARHLLLVAGIAAGLTGCAQGKIIENTGKSVTVRYDGTFYSFVDATAMAQKACAAHGHTARLRSKQAVAFSERYAHFVCM